VFDRVRQFLVQQRNGEARTALLGELRDKYAVSSKLEPLRVEVAATGPAVGPEGAPVTIVEFSDFQCPYCARIVPTLKQVQEEYGDKVRLVFRQFPLESIHPNAQKAAEASLCAGEQGKFWEMHDLMFEEQQQLAMEELKEKAVRLELDAEAFGECVDSSRFAEQVADDLREGSTAGVSGTPAMFINGRFLNGAQPFEAIAKVVDEELERAGASE
jgi:protein-disulfide isomerase